MFQTILAAIDRSPANEQVFNEALLLATATQAKLILLHVLSGEEPDSPIMSLYPLVKDDYHCIHLNPEIAQTAKQIYQQQWKSFEKEGLNILHDLGNKAIANGIETEFTQITGHPSSTICEFAQSCDADLIVIGKRSHSTLQEIFLGSVSNYVIHHTPCSILLVQTSPKQKQTIPSETKIFAHQIKHK